MRKSRVFYAGNLGEDAAPLAWHEGAELEEGDWRLCGRRTEPLLHPTSPGLADDLEAAWNAPGVTMRARQRLLRTVVVDIIADVDEEAREVILIMSSQIQRAPDGHTRGSSHRSVERID